MKEKNKVIEIVKNILIVVLSISAVLLLSFFWKDMTLEDLKSIDLSFETEDDDSYQPELTLLVKPDEVTVNLGSDIYTVINADYSVTEVPAYLGLDEYYNKTSEAGGTTDAATAAAPFGVSSAEQDASSAKGEEQVTYTIYDIVRAAMDKYLSMEDISLEKIEKDQYDEVMSYPSIEAAFSYGIPLSEFLENNGIFEAESAESVATFTTIGLSSASSENLFICDEETGEYYRFTTGDTEVPEYMSQAIYSVISEIDDADLPEYYTIEQLAGVKNDTLIPLYMESSMADRTYEQEFDISNERSLNKIEQAFYPSGLDFVRKITENKGSVLYTYGYSQQVLLLDEYGSLSYSEALDQSGYEEKGFYDALAVAVEYIKNHGGWSVIYKDGKTPYIYDVDRTSEEDGKYSGYTFDFGVILDGAPVEYGADGMLSVTVYGSQVTGYHRDVFILDDASGALGSVGDADAATSTGDTWVAANAINVITDQYETICALLAEKATDEGDEEAAAAYSGEDSFEEMTKRIEHIELCYINDKENRKDVLYPAWHLRIDGANFWCDPETGAVLGYDIGEAS